MGTHLCGNGAVLKSCEPTSDLSLSPGTLVARDALVGNIYDFDFGSVFGTVMQTFSVTNTGSAAPDTLTVSGGTARFAIANDGCTGEALPAGEPRTFDVSFSPPPGGCEDALRRGTAVFIDPGYIRLDVGLFC